MQAEVQHLQRLAEDLHTLSFADSGELNLSARLSSSHSVIGA
jgi:hypothetical protein